MNYSAHAIGEKPVVYAQISDENDLLHNRASFQINPLNQDDDQQSSISKPTRSQFIESIDVHPVFVQPTVCARPHHEQVEMHRPLPNRWADSICDWPKNLFPSCYCACCCFHGMYINAQSKINNISINSILNYNLVFSF